MRLKFFGLEHSQQLWSSGRIQYKNMKPVALSRYDVWIEMTP